MNPLHKTPVSAMSKSISSAENRQSPTPENLQELFSKAVTAHQAGRYEEAENLYRQILAVRPDNVNLLCNLGLLYRETGAPQRALAELEKALTIDAENFGVNLNIGAIHEDLGALDRAEASYRRALELAPHDPRVLNNLGKVLFARGAREEARIFLQRAVALFPDYALAQNNLGVLLGSIGDNKAALAAFEKAILHDPDNPATLYNLAGSLSLAGDRVGAAAKYQKILTLDPDNGCARHMLAALVGEATASAPPEYVVDTFDRYAGYFDEQLTEKLEYRVPELLAGAVRSHVPVARFGQCLDLGCGTGLSGLAFRELAQRLTGVDLSPGMLDRARQKGIYADLHQADIVEHLHRDSAEYDLFIATDVFIYVGDLRPIFQGIAARAAAGAIVAFSIETADDDDFTLHPSGRYAQSPAYIDRLVADFGMTKIHAAPCNIRKEQGAWIDGQLYIVQMR